MPNMSKRNNYKIQPNVVHIINFLILFINGSTNTKTSFAIHSRRGKSVNLFKTYSATHSNTHTYLAYMRLVRNIVREPDNENYQVFGKKLHDDCRLGAR